MPDQPGEADRAPVDERYPEAAAEDPEDRVLCGHPEIAPDGELEAAGDRVPLDRGDDRFGELEAGGAHRAGAVLADPVPLAPGDGLEIGPCAEGPAGPGQHGNRRVGIGIERGEGGEQGVGRRPVDRVAPLGPVDGDEGDRAVPVHAQGGTHDPSMADAASAGQVAVPTRAIEYLTSPVDNWSDSDYADHAPAPILRVGSDDPTGSAHQDPTHLDQKEQHMAIRLGDEAPDFTADTTEGTINFHEYLGDSWGVLFSHPKDFTPVCTTELGAFSKAKAEFDKRNTKLIGLSVDDVASHGKWAGDIEETQGKALNFPLIGDEDRKVADLYDMIHPNASDTLTVRSVFIIGPDKKVKLTLTYPASTGRNVDEILRVLDSLQLTADYKVATPVNWKEGQDVIIVPAVSDEEAKERFPKGFKALKPYLRVTPQPNR